MPDTTNRPTPEQMPDPVGPPRVWDYEDGYCFITSAVELTPDGWTFRASWTFDLAAACRVAGRAVELERAPTLHAALEQAVIAVGRAGG